ncbi:hypothetical protein Tco_0847371 [Tanacetum coccineum]
MRPTSSALSLNLFEALFQDHCLLQKRDLRWEELVFLENPHVATHGTAVLRCIVKNADAANGAYAVPVSGASV